MANEFMDSGDFGGLFKQTASQFGADLNKMMGASARFQQSTGMTTDASRMQFASGLGPASNFRQASFGSQASSFRPASFGAQGASRFTSSFGGPGGRGGFQVNGGGGLAALQTLQNSLSGPIAQKQAERAAQANQYNVGGTVGTPGAMHDGGSDWAHVNQWNSAITDAVSKVQQETGVAVPYDVVKSVMMIESQGDPNVSVSAGGAYGLMQVTAGTMGQYDLQRARSDPAYGIYAGVKELALRYQDSGQKPWENVIVGYFSGHYEPNGSSDGLNSDFNYQQMFRNHMNELSSGASQSTAGLGAGVGTSSGSFNLGMLTTDGHDWGISQGVEESTAMDYSYGHAYGLTGNTHPGVDVTMPRGTKVVSPWGGTVVCVGGSGNGGARSSGCGAYLDSSGGVGRIMIRMDNGDEVVFGHMSGSNYTLGSRVNPGDVIGVSGGYNGDHLHLEYRKICQGTSSGYCVIDPRNGTSGSGYNGSPSGQTSAPARNMMDITIPNRFSGGGSIFGGPSGSSGYNPQARSNVFFGRSLFG